MKKTRKPKPMSIHLHIDMKAYHAHMKETEKVAKEAMKLLKKMGIFDKPWGQL